ncbi:MAG: hypothetical protein ACM37W_24955 [Actinomycetota bacterium]
MKAQTFWLEQSVQDFFGGCNWLGTQLENYSGDANGQALSLTLSVAEFFRAFSWDGIPEVGVMPASSPPLPIASTSEAPDVTLDDLFNLF